MADEKKTKKTAEKSDSKKANAKKSDSKKSDSKKSAKKKSGKANPFKSIASFFKSVRSEGKKVVWPKPLEVLKNSAVVLVVIIISGLIIFGFDQGLSQIFKGVKNYAAEKAATETTTAATSEDALSDLLASADDTADEDTDEVTEAETEAAE